MADVFMGHDATLAVSNSQDLPTMIDSFSIVNKSGGANPINVYVLDGIYSICIAPLNNSLSAGAIYESVRPVLVLPEDQIKVQASGIVDFYFTISNVNP